MASAAPIDPPNPRSRLRESDAPAHQELVCGRICFAKPRAAFERWITFKGSGQRSHSQLYGSGVPIQVFESFPPVVKTILLLIILATPESRAAGSDVNCFHEFVAGV